MAQLSNHLEVFKLLPKTNCRDCGLPTCLAFAVAVIQGGKELGNCPHVDSGISQEVQVQQKDRAFNEQEAEKALEVLRSQIRQIDLAQRAKALDAEFRQDLLILRCLGKEFRVDSQGVLTSECHVNGWLYAPILSYILGGAPREVKGEWVPLRDLPGGADWWRLFGQRCEKPLKKVIDEHTGLLEQIIDIFGGRPAPDSFDSDIAVVIQPLPKLPILLCYWEGEDGMESALHMFFDSTAEKNLNIESIYTLGVGLVTMFKKIALTHG